MKLVEVKRKPGEPTGSLVKRFSGAVQRSGLLLRARAHQFYRKKKSKNIKKQRALRREQLREHYEKLKKLGKI